MKLFNRDKPEGKIKKEFREKEAALTKSIFECNKFHKDFNGEKNSLYFESMYKFSLDIEDAYEELIESYPVEFIKKYGGIVIKNYTNSDLRKAILKLRNQEI